jgi:hypothetical protein
MRSSASPVSQLVSALSLPSPSLVEPEGGVKGRPRCGPPAMAADELSWTCPIMEVGKGGPRRRRVQRAIDMVKGWFLGRVGRSAASSWRLTV